MRASPLRRLAAVAAVAVVVAACGPRFDPAEITNAPGTTTINVPLAGGDGAVVDQSVPDGGAPLATGDTTSPAGDGPSGLQTDTGSVPTTGTPDAGGDTGGDGGGTTPDPGNGGAPDPDPDDGGGQDPGPAPGVTDSPCPREDGGPVHEDLGCIKIGVLVPETGAAPVPSDFESGVSLYWWEKGEAGGTHGRAVELVVRDTESSTNVASTQAQRLLQEGVFTIVSLDRLEVHEAIATVMERAGVPHIMVQSPTPQPATWLNTFTITIDHTLQGRYVADYWASDLGAANGAKKVGFVREQTAALKPGTDAFEARAAELGLDVVVTETIDPSQTSFNSTVLNICQQGAEIVWLYMAPTPAISLMQQAQTQPTCNVTWFANSISWNLDLAQANPNAPAESHAFSPWVSVQSDRASEYRAAYQKYNGSAADDLGLASWGLSEVVDAALEAAGPALGRDSFRRALQNLKVDSFDTWNPVDCTGGPPYSCATQVAVYDDDGRTWEWTGSFRTFP